MGGLSPAGRAGLALAAAFVFSAPALAVNPTQERYEACLAQVGENPEAGYEEGLAWRAQGGGWPAQHCAALGLIAMGETELGARRMLTNAEFAITASDATRAIMYGQAGDAFLIANLPERALTAFQRGRDFAPLDAGLALGAADAAQAAGRWDVVEAAATAAIELDASEARAWRLRAEARLEAGDLDAAEADMEEARRLDPDDIEALLLRGRISETRRGAAPIE
jgi:tetratricopeptide (TPR) repeat protein